MSDKPNRYKEFEQYMTVALCADAAIFVLYLIFAGLGIIWLKVILLLASLVISGYVLWSLYMSKELTRPRSIWMSVGAAAIIVCLLFSLILNYPSPNKYKTQTETAYKITQNL